MKNGPCSTLDTFSLGLPLNMGRLSADTLAGDPLSRTIWRATAVSTDRERDSHACCACSASAHMPKLNKHKGQDKCSKVMQRDP